MKYQTAVVYILLCLFLFIPPHVQAIEEVLPTTPGLVISQIKIKNDTAGLDEFIEIYNPTLSAIDLSNYVLEYFNTTTPSLTQLPTKVTLPEGLIAAQSYLTLAKNISQVPSSLKSPLTSLSDSGGILHLRNITTDVNDTIAWSSTLSSAVDPILYLPSSASTKSFMRSFGPDQKPVVPASWSLVIAAPRSITLLPVPAPVEEPEPEPVVTPIPDPITPPAIDSQPQNNPEVISNPVVTEPIATPVTSEPAPVVWLPLQISELLPNPANPQTDANDEFIEIYNPNDEAVDVEGYSVQTGNNFSYKQILATGTIAPHGYMVLTSGETVLSLANTGGKARLLSPVNEILSETTAYSDAEAGQAWAYINGGWQWTTTPTPGVLNVLTAPIIIAPIVKSVVPAIKKTAAKTSKATKAATTKTPQVKAAKTTKTTKKADTTATTSPTVSDVPPPVHPLVLAGVSGSALLYAGYEYRQDMAKRLYQFRSFRAARRAAREAASGR
jgi:hypothetical protein